MSSWLLSFVIGNTKTNLMSNSLRTLAFVFALGALSLTSCEKDKDEANPQNHYKCTSCVTSPEALAANDGSGKGIYKGVVIGSSGTIKFSLMNGTNDITATMVLDGTAVTLTSAITWTDGQPYVAPFTGSLNGQPVSITFSVQPDGSNPTITSADIPGHPNAVFNLVKETSNALIEAFEGTYSTTKPETGTFNILLSRQLGKWGGTARENGASDKEEINGVIENGTIKNEDGVVMGTLNGDVITGSFQDGSQNTVTIEGERTL